MDENFLNGYELEEWVKDFAKDVGILSEKKQSLTGVVKLLQSEVPTRFRNTRDHLYRDYPEGNEWIDSILFAKQEPSIRSDTKHDFAMYLLDKTVLTDVIIELQDSQGNQKRVAIDVTANASKEQLKFERIQGRREPADRNQENRNANIGKVRKKLGIDQHLILTLNQDKRLLPSYDKLLSELQAFANTPSKTNVINLANVPEQERFINQKPRESPEQIWSRYALELTLKDPAQRISEIASQTFQEGLDQKIAIKVLLEDPFFKDMKSRPLQAQKLASQAIEKIWSEQIEVPNQAKSDPVKGDDVTPKVEQPSAQELPPELEGKPKPEDWLKYASAIGQGHIWQERVKKVVAAFRQGKPLDIKDRISMRKDFEKFQQAVKSVQDWHEVAQQLGEAPDYLKEITDAENNLRQGQPLSDDEKLVMNWDKNQHAYNQLSEGLNQEDPQASLTRLAADAFKQGILRSRIKEILSFSPAIQALKEEKGEQASQSYTTKIMRDAWILKKQEQPKRPPPGQNRGPDIDRGPSRGR